MNTYTVFYVIEEEGLQWQFFRCQADDTDHAEEQCMNSYPTCSIIWVNEGDDQTMIGWEG